MATEFHRNRSEKPQKSKSAFAVLRLRTGRIRNLQILRLVIGLANLAANRGLRLDRNHSRRHPLRHKFSIDSNNIDPMNIDSGAIALLRICPWMAVLSVLTGCPSPTEKSDTIDRTSALSTDKGLASDSGGEWDSDEGDNNGLRFQMLNATGLDHVLRDGAEKEVYSIVESEGGGVGILDFDNDGRLDLMFAGGGTFPTASTISGYPGELYRGKTAFEFIPVRQPARIDCSAFYNHAIVCADFNNDGFSDFVVCGYGGLQLFENLGDGTFDECAKTRGLDDHEWSTAAAWGDINQDGWLDLYVAHYANWSFENNPACMVDGMRDVCGPRDFDPVDDLLYLGSSRGIFSNSGNELGLSSGGRGLGVLSADLDQDGDTDLYVANDELPNFLYRNTEGKLKEIGIRSGAALDEMGGPDGSMGIGVGDYNLDGALDLFVTHYETETCALYRNAGRLNFAHASRLANINAIGNLFVAWGTAFVDFDCDGDEDLLFVNGHAVHKPQTATVAQTPVLLENTARRQFALRDQQSGEFFQQAIPARGLAVGDFDSDGSVDAVVTVINEVPRMLKNETTRVGDWIGVELVGTLSNRNAIGSIIRLKLPDESEQVRAVYSGGTYASTNSSVAHFGFPSLADSQVNLVVQWPDGSVSNLDGLSTKRIHRIVQQ